MNATELAQALRDAKAQLEKSKVEIVDKIATLEAAVSSAGTVTPEVEAALADLKSSVQAQDDIVPDVATATGVAPAGGAPADNEAP